MKSKPSAPPTPSISTISSRSPSPNKCLHGTLSVCSLSHRSLEQPIALFSENTPLLLTNHATGKQAMTNTSTIRCATFPKAPKKQDVTSTTLSTPVISRSGSRSRLCSPSIPPPQIDHGHHVSRHSLHSHSHPHTLYPVVNFIDVLTNSPRICRLGLAPASEHQHHHHQHDHSHTEDDGHSLGRRYSVHRPVGEPSEVLQEAGHPQHPHHGHSSSLPTIGRKRQIVGILVWAIQCFQFHQQESFNVI